MRFLFIFLLFSFHFYLAHGNSDFGCIIDKENPNRINLFDQTIFQNIIPLYDGHAFLIITKKNKILVNPGDETITEHSGERALYFYVDPIERPENDRFIYLTLGRMNKKSPGGFQPSSSAFGHYANFVELIDYRLKLRIMCFRQN